MLNNHKKNNFFELFLVIFILIGHMQQEKISCMEGDTKMTDSDRNEFFIANYGIIQKCAGEVNIRSAECRTALLKWPAKFPKQKTILKRKWF